MQAILARRQLEHGASLSHRTLRLRHTVQLRSLADVEVLLAAKCDFALFSGPKAEVPIRVDDATDTSPGGCDICEVGTVRRTRTISSAMRRRIAVTGCVGLRYHD